MPLVKLYVTPAVLLLLLLLTCRPGQSLPVMSPVEPSSCVSSARTLLHNITTALAQNNLFSGFDCSKENMKLNLESSTAAVCAPMESTCSGKTKPKFDQDSCEREIVKDLRHYYKFLSAQPDPDNVLGSTVLPSLVEFMTNCWSLPLDFSSTEATGGGASSYDERLTLCKVLRGFQDSCEREIVKDLRHYYKFLSAQPDPDNVLGSTVLPSLVEFMTNCWSLPLDFSSTEATGGGASSYDERLTLCKVLRGFQVRTITINRALGYISAGLH